MDIVVLVVKYPSANAEDIRDAGLILKLGDPLEKEVATHSSTLAWRIPWKKGGYSPWDHKVRHDLGTNFHFLSSPTGG